MFATGIENSIPTINHGKTRVDEMEVCGHYERWREDFDCVQEIGINYLRYGPPIHKTYLGPGKFDWEFADQTFAELKRRDITPIVDLCHFGVPDWIGNFQNPDFPRLFAAYAGEFAERFPWVQLYTPINEMFICAVFSAKYGWWNEQLKDDRVRHRAEAPRQGQRHGDDRDPQAPARRDLHSDRIVGIFSRRQPGAIGRAEVLEPDALPLARSQLRPRVDSGMYEYLLDNGMTREEYEWFLNHRLKQHCIFGNDYYLINEHRVFADGHTVAAGETFGYTEITRQYYNRYGCR